MKNALSKTLVLGAASFIARRSPVLRRFLPALPLVVAAFEYWQHRKRGAQPA